MKMIKERNVEIIFSIVKIISIDVNDERTSHHWNITEFDIQFVYTTVRRLILDMDSTFEFKKKIISQLNTFKTEIDLINYRPNFL